MFRDVHAPIEQEVDDLLKRSLLAERIYTRLRTSDCPQAIGIYGGWGTGKTSLLKLLQCLNKHDITRSSQENLHFIIIDAWKYEAGKSLLIPVIVKLKELLGNEDLPSAWQTITRRVLTTSALTAFDALLKKFADVDRKAIKDTYDEVKAQDSKQTYSSILLEWENWSDEIEGTEKAFNEIIDAIRKRKKLQRIILCIDNLDRCSPDHAINLLESIRNFFSVPGCTWILAIDSDVIASYVYKKYEDTNVDGYSYLDKIIPEQYHLSLSPTLDRDGIINLLDSLEEPTGNHRGRIDVNRIPQIPKVLVPRRLIKSARKYYDYYKMPLDVSPSPDMILKLAVLYHTWPMFYQRLSSASKDHIRGILDNFFQKEQEKESVTSGKKTLQVSLDQKFLEDKELVYFVQLVFSEYEHTKSDQHVNEIIIGLRGLRQVGLP